MLARGREAVSEKIPAQTLHFTLDELLEVNLLQGEDLRRLELLLRQYIDEYEPPYDDSAVFRGTGKQVE